jgi:iron complex outermembrane receptor protein
LQTASVFVDGIFALQAASNLALLDLERVEVVKGPQSAVYGRTSFAGAINYITTTPSMEEYSGRLLLDAGDYDQYEIQASFDGPISDTVAFRIGARYYSKGEMYTASDGGALGEQSSNSVFGSLYFQPSDALSIKLRAYFQEDDDGPEAVGFLLGRFNDTCTGTTRAGLDSDGNPITLMPTNAWCGTVPELGSPVTVQNCVGYPPVCAPRAGVLTPDFNTTLFPSFFSGFGEPDYLVTNVLNCSRVGGVPTVDGFGLKRRHVRVSATLDYEFQNGMSLNTTLARNENNANWFRDWDMTATEGWWVSNPQTGTDTSVDVRLASKPDGRLRWLAGANWYEQEFLTSANAGDAVVSCGFGSFIPGFPCTTPANFFLDVDGGDYVDVWGVYGSLSYDITDRWTVDLEGRYQQDQRNDGISTLKVDFNNFVPRISLSFKATQDITLYASAAQGVNPGVINSNVLNCDPTDFIAPYINPQTGQPSTASECAQFAALGFADITPEQELNAFEVGIKSLLLDGRLQVNLAIYTQEWKNNPTSSFIALFKDEDDEGPANRPGDGIPDTAVSLDPASVSGSSDYKGFELETLFVPSENWTLGFNLSYNDNEFTKFRAASAAQRVPYGTDNVAGNRSGRFPEWSGNFNATYTAQARGDWEWYARGDVMFQGEAPAGVTNLANTDSFYLMNARVGMEKEDLRVELYVKNLLDEKAWRGAQEYTDFTLLPDPFFSFSNQGLILVPQDLRTVGFRATLQF